MTKVEAIKMLLREFKQSQGANVSEDELIERYALKIYNIFA